jgi:hypothetical protein
MLANAVMPMAVITLFFATVSIALARRASLTSRQSQSQVLGEGAGQRRVPVVAEAVDR